MYGVENYKAAYKAMPLANMLKIAMEEITADVKITTFRKQLNELGLLSLDWLKHKPEGEKKKITHRMESIKAMIDKNYLLFYQALLYSKIFF
jgi:hypothetical protein